MSRGFGIREQDLHVSQRLGYLGRCQARCVECDRHPCAAGPSPNQGSRAKTSSKHCRDILVAMDKTAKQVGGLGAAVLAVIVTVNHAVAERGASFVDDIGRLISGERKSSESASSLAFLRRGWSKGTTAGSAWRQFLEEHGKDAADGLKSVLGEVKCTAIQEHGVTRPPRDDVRIIVLASLQKHGARLSGQKPLRLRWFSHWPDQDVHCALGN